jgi:hypothetical protein
VENLEHMAGLKGNTSFWETVARNYTIARGLERPYRAATGRKMIEALLKLRLPKRSLPETGRGSESDDQITLDYNLDLILDKIDQLKAAASARDGVRQRQEAERAAMMQYTTDLTQRRGQKRARSRTRGIVWTLYILIIL